MKKGGRDDGQRMCEEEQTEEREARKGGGKVGKIRRHQTLKRNYWKNIPCITLFVLFICLSDKTGG